MDLVRRADLPEGLESDVLSALIFGPDLLSRVRPALYKGMFKGDETSLVAGCLLRLFDDYGKVPSIRVLSQVVQDSRSRNAYPAVEWLGSLREPEDRRYVEDRVIEWARWRVIDEVVKDSDGMTSDEFIKNIGVATQIGGSLSEEGVTLDGEVDFDDLVNEPVPTPWDFVNKLNLVGPTKGDLCEVLAFINVGKTTFLVNVATEGIRSGRRVLYFTFEDGEKKIRRRVLQCATGMTVEQIMATPNLAKKRRDKFLRGSGGSLTIKKLNINRTTVADVRSWVESNAAKEGPPDLVVIDYADRFKSSRVDEKRHEYREVFENCKALAVDTNTVVWTASQVQRQRAGEAIVGLQHVAESMGKVESADLVIGLGQDEAGKKFHEVTFNAAKVRDGEGGHNLRMRFEGDVQRIVQD